MKSEIVVVAWDFSKYAKAALQYALENLEPQNIRVLCVLERPNPYAFGVNWGPDAEENARKKCAEDFFSEAKHAKNSGVQFFAEFGDPLAKIVRFAMDQKAELIVMSTHGRTGIGRLVIGSVAQKVLTRAACPVVILPSHCVNKEADSSQDQVANMR